MSPSPDVASPTRGTPGSSQRLGEILVTTDDDVQVPEGWLDLLLEPFERNDVWAVCGNVQPMELTSPRAAGVRIHGRPRQGIRPIREPLGEPIGRRGVHSGRGTWEPPRTRRSARECLSHPEIGLMDEALGPGMPSGVGEDSYLLYRIVRAGYTVVYEPAAFVYHRHRSTEDDLNRQLDARTTRVTSPTTSRR